jgi:phosphoribosylamine--glycine ligase
MQAERRLQPAKSQEGRMLELAEARSKAKGHHQGIKEIFLLSGQFLIQSEPMKILVIGSGGREHALVWKLAKSPRADKIWCAPGNVGIALERLNKNGAPVECVHFGAEDLHGLLGFAQASSPDLTVVGPDNPLALGIVDLFQKNQLPIWGPNKKAAQFESSKVFAQRFMQKYRIPSALSGTFAEPKPAKTFAASLGGRCAVKVDGLALGKGVLMCTSTAEADKAIDEILVRKSFGLAGATIVIQEFLEGTEISLHALCDGKTAKLFPTSQDHKRALDGDRGLNTGGMGAYSPTPFLGESLLAEVEAKILSPWLQGCAAEGIDFRGILYPGLMLTKSGPKVLEFNARFGDPETQVYLTRLADDLLDLLEASAEGGLGPRELNWKSGCSVCVVMASGGYPGNYQKGKVIQGLHELESVSNVKIFHAGTSSNRNEIVTNGGRVLGVTAWSDDLPAARQAAYAAVSKIQFEGAHFRTDIAAQALRQTVQR